ncbi:eukaryotic rRNA processing [Absidia repens]|uniref:Eukaryotic rRNA processing n=1 Tax=Absidia repens TaxID=90262 RepID=A0A1X2IQ00_9FUNG|nr:eukaryotic rRNA processing [Absidia repens]
MQYHEPFNRRSNDSFSQSVRQRLLDEAAQNKASEEAKRQRNLKNLAKRSKYRNNWIDKKKNPKRWIKSNYSNERKDGSNNESLTLDNDFDVALDQGDLDNKRQKKGRKSGGGKPTKRQIKDTKYGFGRNRGKHHKSNTAESSGDVGGYRKKGCAPNRGGNAEWK